MEKTKRDSRHIDPLKDEEKFFQREFEIIF